MSAAHGAAVVYGNRDLLARIAIAALLTLLTLLLLIAVPLALLQQQQATGIAPGGVPAGARPFLAIYTDAAAVHRVNPFLLMAVHEDESNFGRSTLPGVRSGVNSAGCCAGPMQFSITGTQFGGRGGTWEGYRSAYRAAKLQRPDGYPNRGVPHPSVYDSYDSLYAAAAYFKALGAGPQLDQRTYQALVSYKGRPPASIPYARHDYERAKQLERAASRAPAGSGRLRWPVTGPITGSFGEPRPGHLHSGLDIAAPEGTAIAAAAGGRVTFAGWSGGYGNYTCIQHTRALSTCYAHQSRLGTRQGAPVTQGQPIGRVGNTGNSFGAHLHFEVRVDGTPVDPLPYLTGGRR